MNRSYTPTAAWSAILVGALSILYAVFYLGITRVSPNFGLLGSWVILAVSGIFSLSAYAGLYTGLRQIDEHLALWAVLLGAAASFATFQHGAYEALLLAKSTSSTTSLPSQVDPAGLAAFFAVGLVSYLFSSLILRSKNLPRGLGTLGIVNSILLVILFFASAAGSQTLILLSGGLTSVIAGPIWWIWLGVSMLRGN